MNNPTRKTVLLYIFLVLIFTFLFRHFTKGTNLENLFPLIPGVVLAIILLLQNLKKRSK